MSYVTRPIGGFQITFLTSVQPNDRLLLPVREHSRLSRLFRLRHGFTGFLSFHVEHPCKQVVPPIIENILRRPFFLRSSFLRVTISGICSPPSRFVAFYPVLFLAFLTQYRVSFQPVLSGDILHDFRVLASMFQRFTPQQQCTEHSFLFHFVSFLACIASSFWCFRSRRKIYVVAFYFRVHSFDRIAPTPQRQPPSRSEQTDRQRRQTRLLETVDNEAEIKVSLSVCLLNRPGR